MCVTYFPCAAREMAVLRSVWSVAWWRRQAVHSRDMEALLGILSRFMRPGQHAQHRKMRYADIAEQKSHQHVLDCGAQ